MNEPSACAAEDVGNRRFDNDSQHYDAVLVVSFGGPEGPDDVSPFLDNVLGGRPIPPAAKARIAERYLRFGGVSPINGHTRTFVEALRASLRAADLPLPVYWGNRNWHPFLSAIVRQMAEDGIRRAVAYVTSPFGSYSSCRQYRQDVARAAADTSEPPHIDILRKCWNHPGFVTANADRVGEALLQAGNDAALLFTAHSLPERIASHSPYEAQLRDACSLVADAVDHVGWRLAFQSASASFREPWLQPTVGEALRAIREEGAEKVVVAPIGFVCDHMEVVLDLDIDARAEADALGLNMVRAATVGTHPAYVQMVRDLIVERMAANPKRPSMGTLGTGADFCPADCCPQNPPRLQSAANA